MANMQRHTKRVGQHFFNDLTDVQSASGPNLPNVQPLAQCAGMTEPIMPYHVTITKNDRKGRALRRGIQVFEGV